MRKGRNLNRIANLPSKRPRSVKTWAMRHLQAMISSLGKLTRTPLSTLMTAAVISIALAFPAGLKILLDNAQRLSGSLDNSANISIFLKHGLDDAKYGPLADKLEHKDGVAALQLITPEDALEEFRNYSGFAGALDALDNNPLPAVIVITPTQDYSTPQKAEELVADLRQMPEVDIAQLDLEWVRRFQALTEVAARGILLLASLLALAVLLIIGNTIRLEIQNQKDEIEITKLIGGTNAFIRRPFLYTGFWYGMFGGLLAWLLVSINLWLLTEPIKKLAGLYHSNFSLTSIDATSLLILIVSSSMLGLFGSWIAVAKHLHAIEPE